MRIPCCFFSMAIGNSMWHLLVIFWARERSFGIRRKVYPDRVTDEILHGDCPERTADKILHLVQNDKRRIQNDIQPRGFQIHRAVRVPSRSIPVVVKERA
jgi:hypothetical protein